MTELTVSKIKQLEQALQLHPGVAFAVLVGSQRTGLAHAQSDWDIAVQWREALSLMEKLAQTELLRHELKNLLDVEEQQVDLIDTAHARLAMRALVAEEGQVLVVNDELAWVRFLKTTWFELEDHYWREQHAA
jgi:predicted nucleotidyltransferase